MILVLIFYVQNINRQAYADVKSNGTLARMNALNKCGVVGNQNLKESGLNIKKPHFNNIFINVLMPLKSLSLLYHIYNGFLHGFITLW